jgi:hypothetical protein
MNEEKQIIAIAEACGYVLKHCKYHKTTSWHTEGGFCMEEHTLPDYLNDLNAMHEAEKVLTDDQLFVMSRWLQHSTRSTLVGVAVMTATASQRAEAFLKTINKWEDSE